uniref:Uncharacterized protein n=1 Tax=Tolypothrix bouteillei VB521301 TaxID=1479485 RepID=A0A0C1R2J9_9CYAN
MDDVEGLAPGEGDDQARVAVGVAQEVPAVAGVGPHGGRGGGGVDPGPRGARPGASIGHEREGSAPDGLHPFVPARHARVGYAQVPGRGPRGVPDDRAVPGRAARGDLHQDGQGGLVHQRDVPGVLPGVLHRAASTPLQQ